MQPLSFGGNEAPCLQDSLGPRVVVDGHAPVVGGRAGGSQRLTASGVSIGLWPGLATPRRARIGLGSGQARPQPPWRLSSGSAQRWPWLQVQGVPLREGWVPGPCQREPPPESLALLSEFQ